MKEEEIRPQKLFNQYLEFCEVDVRKYFSDFNNYKDVSCPSCGSDKAKEKFEKNKFTYKWCLLCKTLYVSPLPPEDNFKKYYNNLLMNYTYIYKHIKKSEKRIK